MTIYQLWDETPGLCLETPVIEYYPAEKKKTQATVVILPGGGYCCRADHEGKGYAEYLNRIGMDAFVCEYRVAPHRFPLELLDARRAIRFVRAHAEEFGIDPECIAVMGSSAGGHLAGLVSNYTDPIDFENIDDTDKFSPYPNAAILCYAVGHMPDEMELAHRGSFEELLGDRTDYEHFSTDLLVNDNTPPTFIFHTAEDQGVNVINSYLYATECRKHNVPVEMHIFPHGRHGLGLAEGRKHVCQWPGLMKNWFIDLGWLEEDDD